MVAAGDDRGGDPSDPRVAEEIRAAVRRARDSAFGSYMSEQDIVRQASGYYTTEHGPLSPAADSAIRAESRRQAAAPGSLSRQQPAEPYPASEAASAPAAGTAKKKKEKHKPPSASARPPEEPWDALMRAVITDWLADEDIYTFLGAAPPSAVRTERNWADGTAPADFYRAQLTALAVVYQAVGRNPDAGIRQCEQVVSRVLDHIHHTWEFDGGDLASGFVFASMHLDGVFANHPGLDVATVIYDLRMEIACLADCFRGSRALGR